MSTSHPQLPDMAFLKAMAKAGGEQALAHFRANVGIDNKLDGGFDPVTIADRDTEAALRAMIAKKFPDHGILGEEHGTERADAKYLWVIDPIDGTRAYISGLPVWGILTGFLVDGIAHSGFMAQPYTGEFYATDGKGSVLIERGGSPKPISTRACSNIADAVMFTTTPALYTGSKRDAYDALEADVRLARYGCDCYAFAMLAAGHVDIVLEPGLQPYDICGLVALIEQAGGMVSTWDGGRPEKGGDIVATGSPQLHEKVLAKLAR